MPSKSIVIIEDDVAIRRVLGVLLKSSGFPIVKEAENGDEGLKLVREIKPSLVLLDLMLPGIDGFTVCKNIRENKETSSIPVIILTAKSEEEDIVRGLECGADDYITKPFSKQVLLARIRAVLRRPDSMKDSVAQNYDGLCINPESYTVQLSGKSLDLTSSEYRLLTLLLSRPERVYTRSQIIDLTDPDKAVTDRAVDVQIVGLRRKLGTWAKHIETIRGVGSRFRP